MFLLDGLANSKFKNASVAKAKTANGTNGARKTAAAPRKTAAAPKKTAAAPKKTAAASKKKVKGSKGK